MTKITEMTDAQNITLECAQEADKDPNAYLIDADRVVRYAAEQGIEITKAKATRTLGELHNWGLIQRQPRSSRGWGMGWDTSSYRLTDAGRIKPHDAR